MAFEKSIQKLTKALDYFDNVAPTIMGVEAVNHFKESFVNQGFTDRAVEKWDEVERRKPASSWYGFQYGANANREGSKRRKEGSTTHYSPAAEKRPILSGQTQDLMNSIDWQKIEFGVKVYAEGVQAKLLNEGGPMKVFGRSGKTMPKRQYIGQSEVLRNKIRAILLKDLHNLLK